MKRLFFFVFFALVSLAGMCQSSDITDTYWRNDATGDWLIGFTEKHVIYKNKVWDVISMKEKNGTYTLTIDDGSIIKVGKLKKGSRAITFRKEIPIVCSLITGEFLLDYPTKDTRVGFVDNGYNTTDSVIITGWLKDAPKEMKCNRLKMDVHYPDYISSLSNIESADTDSLGRFTIKMPLPCTTCMNVGVFPTVLEPGKTYFLLLDFKAHKCLWMGDDARLQNELLLCPTDFWEPGSIPDELRSKTEVMDYKMHTDSILQRNMDKLQQLIQQHPNLSQRSINFMTGLCRMLQGESMMRARFAVVNRKLPKEYLDYISQNIWQKVTRPYTLYPSLGLFMDGYFNQVEMNSSPTLSSVYRELDQNGIVSLMVEEKESLDKLDEFYAGIDAAKSDEEKDSLANAFCTSKNFGVLEAMIKKYGSQSVIYNYRKMLDTIDSLELGSFMRDCYLVRQLYSSIDHERRSLDPSLLEFAEKEVRNSSMLDNIRSLNEKYVAIEKRDISNLSNLKSAKEVENLSDGEMILRKLTEPYRGKIILLDIWGTWCSPCKEGLSHSAEEYERLKDFDLVYLYLANRSPEENWKNVIKEYNVLGDNVVHYNLPKEQQDAVEQFLKVTGFPTYKLIDRNGDVLDVNADPRRDLDGLARQLENIK